MNMKSTIAALLFLSVFALSGVEKPMYETSSGIGIAGGAIGGIGFAYRKYFQNRFGLQAAALGLGSKDGDYSSAWLNAGAQGMYTLHKNDEGFFRLYLLGGVGLYADGYKGSYWYSDDSNDDEFYWDITTTLGAGLGMEFVIRETVAITVDSPLSAFFRDSGGFDILPVPGLSIVYYLD
ncbi:MAG: hypothetical protein ACQEQV_01950 [Fibrobacterota bacterium]